MGGVSGALEWLWSIFRWPVRAAFFIIAHAVPVAAFIGVFFFLQWLIATLSGQPNPELFPGVPLKYVIVTLDVGSLCRSQSSQLSFSLGSY